MKTLLGGILLALGLLIAGASGLCSLTVLAMSTSGQMGEMVPMVLLFGGIPFLIGAGLVYAGRAIVRSDRNQG